MGEGVEQRPALPGNSQRRVAATVAYLRSKGLLQETDENDQVFRRSERWYGWTLWDVRFQTDR